MMCSRTKSFLKLRILQHWNSYIKPSHSINKLEDDYEIISQIGKGSTSQVYLGYDIVTLKKVIIKLFKPISDQTIQRQIYINRILTTNNCPNIINLIGVIRNEGCQRYGLIFQHINGTPLNILTYSKELRQNLSTQQSLRIIKQVLQVLEIMHSLKMIHRDIKPANILISGQQTFLNAQLFDFGLTLIQNQHKLKNKFGTKCYKCPQTVFLNSHYTNKVDIWGIGIILAQLLLKKRRLLQYRSDIQMMQQIVNLCGYSQKIIPQQLRKYVRQTHSYNWGVFNKELDKGLIELIKQMIQINPQNRPSATQLLNNQIFKAIN